MYRLHHQGEQNQRARNNVSSTSIFLCSVLKLMVTAVRSSLILSNLMMATCSTETSVRWRYISEDGILYSHRRENLKSYIALTDWTL
jgi:hypothetical protein